MFICNIFCHCLFIIIFKLVSQYNSFKLHAREIDAKTIEIWPEER